MTNNYFYQETEVGIYKIKQESKITRKHACDQEKKIKENTLSTKKADQEKNINFHLRLVWTEKQICPEMGG